MSVRLAGHEIRGVIFDLDGTLVDSCLDFDAMRREMGLPPGQPILEAIAELEPGAAERCLAILARHEHAGADRAVAMPGAGEFLSQLHRWGIKRGILTRNSRTIAEKTLARLALEFDLIVGREDGPVKPDPAGIWRLCEAWQLPREKVVLIGDYRFDLDAARAAQVRAVLYLAGRDVGTVAYAHLADTILPTFGEAAALLGLRDVVA